MFDELYNMGHAMVVNWAKDHADILPRLTELDLTVCIWENDFEIVREMKHVIYCKAADDEYIIGYLTNDNRMELRTYMSYITDRTPKCITVNGKDFNNFNGNRNIIHSAFEYIQTILSIGGLDGNEQG